MFCWSITIIRNWQAMLELHLITPKHVLENRSIINSSRRLLLPASSQKYLLSHGSLAVQGFQGILSPLRTKNTTRIRNQPIPRPSHTWSSTPRQQLQSKFQTILFHLGAQSVYPCVIDLNRHVPTDAICHTLGPFRLVSVSVPRKIIIHGLTPIMSRSTALKFHIEGEKTDPLITLEL
jgi:hypothetical protein